MSVDGELYKNQVLTVEPTGIEPVLPAQRHGNPRGLFGVWFSANAEIATWMVGVFITSLYGTDLKSAAAGIVLGNVAGYALLGVMSLLGPKYGVPQLVASRLAFGRRGNVAPATLSFLAGIGWFAINTIFGAYAMQTITGLPYFVALAIMLALQIVLAVYGYNLIHVFERASVVLLAAGFALLAAVTLHHLSWSTPFNPHAPLAAGGKLAGFLFASALSFSYATGWVPCAADYSRYLPQRSDPRAVWFYAFAGSALPCIVIEFIGAASMTVTHVNLSSGVPTDVIGELLGSGVVAKLMLLVVVLGTLTANCMNLYSGALAALVALGKRLPRWSVALAVGVLGSLIATGGGHPRATATGYTNFLLLLSYWASPWAAVVLADWWQRGKTPGDTEHPPRWRVGVIAWLVGLFASGPFWNQALVGPFARAFPQFGDLSYYVGFVAAGLAMLALNRETIRPAIGIAE